VVATHREGTTAEGPIDLDRMDIVDRLRAALLSLGYTGDAVRELLGDDAYQGRARDVPVHLRRLTSGTPLETAIRFFFLGVPVERAALDAALASPTTEELEELGVSDCDGTTAQATVRIVPQADLLLAGNRYPDETAAGGPADYVATVTAPSAILGALTVRSPARTALDIGTGSGVQAIWAAQHCERVVAVDVNPRALNLAAFNARLNEVANIEFREGSLFEPVAGELFDLVLCNAPYVVSPDQRYAFRDGGAYADGFSEHLVREAPKYLEEGGFAHLLVSWIVRGDDWAERPRSWIEGSECDAWLLLGASRDPVTYAAIWNEELSSDSAAFADTLDRWLGYLAEIGADGVIEGAVVLHRRSGAPRWLRADRVPATHPAPASDHVLRVFDGNDHLAELAGDEALLDESPRVAERARAEQELTFGDGGYVVESMTIVLDEGLGFRAGVDQNTATLLPLLDGSRTLREAIEAAAASRGVEGGDLDAFRAGALEIARTMLALGFLSPGDR
jgi:SAM-dependent methyltransferase